MHKTQIILSNYNQQNKVGKNYYLKNVSKTYLHGDFHKVGCRISIKCCFFLSWSKILEYFINLAQNWIFKIMYILQKAILNICTDILSLYHM